MRFSGRQRRIGARWAVIGGLAVAFRAEPRFTKDVDMAVAVADDREAEDIVNRLQVRGYALASLVEQDYVNRLATARLVRPKAGTSSAFIDLLFANAGIEEEIVRAAERLEVLPGIFLPVASTGHLIALKALAGRHQDMTDLGYLIAAATDDDLDQARTSAALIQERGFSRGQNLPEDLAAIISQARKWQTRPVLRRTSKQGASLRLPAESAITWWAARTTSQPTGRPQSRSLPRPLEARSASAPSGRCSSGRCYTSPRGAQGIGRHLACGAKALPAIDYLLDRDVGDGHSGFHERDLGDYLRGRVRDRGRPVPDVGVSAFSGDVGRHQPHTGLPDALGPDLVVPVLPRLRHLAPHHVLGGHQQDARPLRGDARRRVGGLGVVADADAVPEALDLEDRVLVAGGEDLLPGQQVRLAVDAGDLAVLQHDGRVVHRAAGTLDDADCQRRPDVSEAGRHRPEPRGAEVEGVAPHVGLGHQVTLEEALGKQQQVSTFGLRLFAESPDAGDGRVHVAEDLLRLARPDCHDSPHGQASVTTSPLAEATPGPVTQCHLESFESHGVVDRPGTGNREYQELPGTRTRCQPSEGAREGQPYLWSREPGKGSRTYGKEKVNSSILLRGSQVSGRFRSRDRPFRMPVQQQSAAVASGAELVAELEERLACRRGHDFGVDLHRDGDLAVPQDLYGHARVNVQAASSDPGAESVGRLEDPHVPWPERPV
jgi:hypothetical protein